VSHSLEKQHPLKSFFFPRDCWSLAVNKWKKVTKDP